MTEPTVRPDTRIWTKSVTSVDLAFLRECAVGILGALRPPALGEHGLHDVGLGPLVAFESGTNELGRPRRIAGEVGAPLVAKLVRRRGRCRARLALEGDDDYVV